LARAKIILDRHGDALTTPGKDVAREKAGPKLQNKKAVTARGGTETDGVDSAL
jgi:hypothetical protein